MTIKKPVIILSTILLFSSSVLAREGIPTNHSHDGRAHTHPLPAEGLSHNHKYKAPINEWTLVHSTRASTWSSDWYAKKGSLVVANGRRTVMFRTVMFKVVEPSNFKEIKARQSISNSDCAKETGMITTHNADGRTAGRVGFQFGQKKIPSSSIAEYICKTAR